MQFKHFLNTAQDVGIVNVSVEGKKKKNLSFYFWGVRFGGRLGS